MEYIVLGSVIAVSSILVASLQDRRALTSFMTVLMISVPLLGQAALSFYGLTSNVGNVFYAGVVFCMMAGTIMWGKEYGFKAVKSVFIALMSFHLFAAIVIGTTGIGVEHQQAHQELFDLGFRLVAASYIAFYGVQSALVYFMDKFKHENLWLVIPPLATAVQLIDSAIFFPIAFGGILSVQEMIQFTVDGFVLKVMFALATIPFLIVMQKRVCEHDTDSCAF